MQDDPCNGALGTHYTHKCHYVVRENTLAGRTICGKQGKIVSEVPKRSG
jgi:hypothetical protein